MEIDPQKLVWPAAAAIAASVAVCATVAVRLHRGRPVLPYEPRRPVPWRWPELLFILLAMGLIGECVAFAAARWFLSPPAAAKPPLVQDAEAAHPLVVLLQVDHRAGALLLVLLTGVVVAPICEEFFFRLVLQGWLEAVERRWRRAGFLRGLIPGAMPVVTVSILFGAIHFRAGPQPTDPDVLVRLFAMSTAVEALTFGFAVAILYVYSGANASDLGLVPGKVPGDIGLGLAVFLAIAAPIYILEVVLGGLLGNAGIVDPITLTFFAMALGTLYYRTHRIVPSIVLHMSLNATSVAMALWLFSH